MKVAQYVLLWVAGTAAVVALLEPPPGLGLSSLDEPALLASLLAGPTATVEQSPPVDAVSTQQLVSSAQLAIGAARDAARGYADLDRGRTTVRRAALALQHDPADALVLVGRVLEVSDTGDLASLALWLRGDALARSGDWQAALDAWERIEATPVDDYLALRRGQALLELGHASTAADRMSDLVDELADSNYHTVHEARALRLEALHLAGRHAELIGRSDDFLDYYGEYPREDEVWSWRAQAFLALDDAASAARELDRIVWRYPYRPLAQGAWLTLRTLAAAGVDVPSHSLEERLERADHLRVNKHWSIVESLLADLLRGVLAEQGEGSLANDIRWERWRNAYGSGDFEAALAHLESIRAVGFHGLSRYQFYSELSDTYARLRRYEDGVEALRVRDSGRSSVRLHLELAEYYFRTGHFEESLAHSREVLSERAQRQWDFSLLLFLAGEFAEAADHFADLTDHSGGTTGRRNRYFLGRAHQELGDDEAARDAFERVIASDSDGYYGLQSHNRRLELDRSAPSRLFVEGEPHPALPLVDDPLPVGVPHPASLDAMAGDVLERLDLNLSELVRRRVEPDAAASSGGASRFQRPARLHWDGPDGLADTRLALVASGHEIESAYWIRPDENALADAAARFGDLFPALSRADFLNDLGYHHDARLEAREAAIEMRGLDRSFGSHRPNRARPIRLGNRLWAHYIDNRSYDTGYWGVRLSDYRFGLPGDIESRTALGDRQIAIYDNRLELRDAFHDALMTVGDYNFVRRFALERGGWARAEAEGEQREDWSEAFPRAYPDLVTHWSDVYDLNPYIVWALMRVESSFNPDSISRANARGLLQVIPKTGELISQRLGYWDFGPHNLMRPELSIEYGCYYFHELLTKFHGQELIAFAGYNGGPHNVARWLEGRGRAPLDAFIETIPFEQAREYSKKVYRFIALYRRIYLGEEHLYVGNVVDRDYELNIHF